MIFGIDTARKVVPAWVSRTLLAAGLLLYAGVGFAGIFLGGNYLNYSVLSHEPTHGQHLGILLIEFGVGTTVAGAMITIFFIFAAQDRKDMELVGLFNYWIVIVLMMAGFYVVIAQHNLVKKVVGLNVFQVSVFLFYISMSKVEGGTAPILAEGIEIYANPLPHVLILTAIVVGVATTALALALVVRIREAYGTIEEDEIENQEEEA